MTEVPVNVSVAFRPISLTSKEVLDLEVGDIFRSGTRPSSRSPFPPTASPSPPQFLAATVTGSPARS